MPRVLQTGLAASCLLTSLYAVVLEPGPADWRPHRYGHQPRRRYSAWPDRPAALREPAAFTVPASPSSAAGGDSRARGPEPDVDAGSRERLIRLVPKAGKALGLQAEVSRVGPSQWRWTADASGLDVCLASDAMDTLQALPVVDVILWLGWCDAGVPFPSDRREP